MALALEANNDLNWRDIQHITVRGARPEGNLKAEDWTTNGIGLRFSHAFGFGLMDAGAMTRLAKDWVTVPEQINCTTAPKVLAEPIRVEGEHEEIVSLDASGCSDIE